MIDDLELLLRRSVEEVFGTMLKKVARPVAVPSSFVNHSLDVASSVGFIGELTGVIYVFSTSGFAHRLTHQILDLPEGEEVSPEMVNDAMGEVANMIVGNLKASLSDRGISCVLTIPSIVRGSHFAIETVSSATRRVVCFRCGDQDTLVTEIMIKPIEGND
ncbi:MAG TPA: chemotaxis protein CheX [Methylomirabilota bacterium]|nr:chemotaxis protein CheX [Methylomirabilota bacterium]